MVEYIDSYLKGKQMSSILLISDDDLISQLYTTNLSVYLDTDIKIVSDMKSACIALTEKDFNLIISLAMVNNEESLESLKIYFKENQKIIPIITVGESGKADKDIVEIKSYYSVQKIIRAAAKILGVTAKDMAEKVVPKYYAIDLKFFYKIKKAPASLFIEMQKNNEIEYVLFANKDTEIDKIISKFKSEGVEKIFVNPNDRLAVINSISISICESLTLSNLIDKTEKSELISTSMDFVGKSIVSNEVSNEIISLVNSCSKVMTEVIQDSPDLNSLLAIFLRNKNGFAYLHSMLSAYVAAHIVKHVSWGGESHIEKLNFVLFFHDVPLAPIFEKNPEIKNEEDLLFQGNLTDAEKEIVLNHARISAELVSGLKKCPMGADLLIKQHHGMGNGIGFAVEYRDDVSPLSKVIIISEAFVEELLRLRDQGSDKISVGQIMAVLNERFSKHTYKKIIETLVTLKI